MVLTPAINRWAIINRPSGTDRRCSTRIACRTHEPGTQQNSPVERLDFALRQCLLHFPHALVGDRRVEDVQRLEFRKSLQTLQTGIADPRAPEAQRLELRQSLQMLQAGIGDLRGVEVQRLELLSPFRCSKPASVTGVP